MKSKNRTRTIEGLKTALIAILAVSALLFGRQTRLFGELFYSIPVFRSIAELVKGVSAPPTDESGPVMREAARPLCIVITDETGGHYGVRYDTETKNTLYVRTSGLFGEALGSSDGFMEISESAWRTALALPGVFFEYANPVKLSVLSGWLGSRTTVPDGDVTLRRIFVTFGEDISRIYYEDAQTGTFYRSGAQSSGGRSVELGMYTESNAVFAYETGEFYARSAPYYVLLPGDMHPYIRVSAAGSRQEMLDMILSAFGESSQIKPSYSASDGALVYVGANSTVRVWADGGAVFINERAGQPESGLKELSENEMIERARVIMADTIGAACGAAEVHFLSTGYDGGGSFTATFSYYIAGGRIYTGEDGIAGKITFSGGAVTEASFRFRSYEPGDDFIKLLPERQALAAAGSEFILAYRDFGPERLMPVWAGREPEGQWEG